MAEQPGVMLYWEDFEAMLRLPKSVMAEVLRAVLSYSRDGVEPELSDLAAVVWLFMRGRLDRDRARYAEIVEKRRRAAQASAERRREHMSASVDSVEQNQPTTTPTPAPTSTPTPSPTSAPTSTPAPAPAPASAPASTPVQRAEQAFGRTGGRTGGRDGF